MNDAYAAMEDLSAAVAEYGESGTLSRTTTTVDPTNPTRTIQVTVEYSVMFYLNYQDLYVAGSLIAQRVGTAYIDYLSIVDPDTDEAVNSPDSLTVISRQGDKLTRADGSALTLLANTSQLVSGTPIMGVHNVEA